MFVGNIGNIEKGNEIATIERPCKRCGCSPTKEGYDACLGYIEGATSACCGHGVEKGFIMYPDKTVEINGDLNEKEND